MLKINICEFKYRKALEKDIPEIYNFEANYMKEVEPENYQAWANTKKTTYNLVLENLDNINIAVIGGVLIGHCYWSMLNSQPHIFSIYVMPKYRNKGVAKKLLTAIENDICSKNFNACFLSALENNPAKKFFYKAWVQAHWN